jgi:hypothetical protein
MILKNRLQASDWIVQGTLPKRWVFIKFKLSWVEIKHAVLKANFKFLRANVNPLKTNFKSTG